MTKSKKSIVMHGMLLCPLVLGHCAFLRANGSDYRTSPVVAIHQQSEDLVRYMLREFEEDPARIWDSNMFGKSLYELVNEGIHAKLEHMPEASRQKLSETLERIINEGSGGLICILL